jgi:hypothetical protein
VLLFFHGGGYCSGSPRSHRRLEGRPASARSRSSNSIVGSDDSPDRCHKPSLSLHPHENRQFVIPITDGLGRFWQSLGNLEEVAMNGDPIALRPTWKSNLGWLLLVAVIVIAVAS